MERRGEPQASGRRRSAALGVRYRGHVTTLNLRTLKIRSGEQFQDEREIRLEPLELGGQRYQPVPETVPAGGAITRATTGTGFQLGFDVRPHRPGFRCLEDARLDPPISAPESHAAAPAG